METVYTVTRSTKSKTIVVGHYGTEAEAKTAMVEHFSSTPKHGKFHYRISVEELREIGGVMFRSYTSGNQSTQYTREVLEAMVCTA